MDCFVIINPISGKGKGEKVWPKIKTLLSSRYKVSHAFSKHSKHEIEIAQNAIKKGFKTLIVVGGDGTFKNAINGVLKHSIENIKSITFGFIPLGTGNDWVKTHKIPSKIEDAIAIILEGKTDTQDIGCITFINSEKPQEYFINLAGMGFDGRVVNIVEKGGKNGAITYLLATLKGLFSFSNFNANISSSNYSYSGETFLIQFGICKYSGNGMQLTDAVNPKDGLLDITVAKKFRRWDIIKNIYKLFNGTVTKHKEVDVFKTNKIKVVTKGKNKPYAQADGELLGQEDMEVSILKQVLKFYC